jgi:glycosyltransferase involved in cell wall biosynthesis
MKNLNGLSVIIPVYNEELSLKKTLEDLKKELAELGINYEIITVDDGSTDDSRNQLKSIANINIIKHPYNKGYGAALKTGLHNAQYNWLLFFDADGQHQAKYIKDFIVETDKYDLIAGDRSQSKYVRPAIRKPGLWILKVIANYLVDYKIPDLNCGFRLVNKTQLEKFLHLMPNGFSMSTTTTLAFLKAGLNVKFIHTETNKRNNQTKSTVKPSDAIKTFTLIFKLIMTFSPLRFFFPISCFLLTAGLIYTLLDIIKRFNLSDGSIILLISSLLVLLFGLIADQLASIRRDIFIK